MPTPIDPLDPLLDRWVETDQNAPALRQEVWRRIGAAARGRRAPRGFWAEIEAWLTRPPFAVLFVVCCALCGLFLAEVRVNRHQRERSAEIARSYLQLIDPLLQTNAVAKLP